MNAKSLLVASLTLLGLGFVGSVGVCAEIPANEAAFKKYCVNCHSLTPGLSSIAPDLVGVVGRKAGTLKTYKYSAALKDADFVWSPEKLNEWLKSPHGILPETEMTFVGLKNDKERAQIVDFLEHYAPNK